MQKDTQTALLFCGIGVMLLVIFFSLRSSASPQLTTDGAVSIENGVQIIDISAKGGFSPSIVQASAGIPTELRVATNGTYDCSSTLVIPALGYDETLSPTGTEVIALTAEQAQGTLEATCGMGMYKFEITFE